jgi:hypothetical protein
MPSADIAANYLPYRPAGEYITVSEFGRDQAKHLIIEEFGVRLGADVPAGNEDVAVAVAADLVQFGGFAEAGGACVVRPRRDRRARRGRCRRP